MENIDRLGSTSTNSAVEDGLGSTSRGSTSINDGSIMNDLRNLGGSLFDTDSNSDSEAESNNTAVEVSYLPDCPSQLKPYIGQIFLRLDDATEFYNKYARHVGFDTRKHGSKKKVDHVTWLYVVCSREGQRKMKMQGHESKRRRSSRKCFCKAKIAFKFCKGIGYVVNQFYEIHNHDMVELRHMRFMRLNRNIDLLHQKFILDCASANIGPTLTFKLLNEVLGGLDYVGCTVVEVRNYRRDLRAYTSGADAQMVLNEMSWKKENCPAFTYDFEVNSQDMLTRLFWCDPIAKKNFHLYGDIVSFDTTYSTNRYCMIFAPFTGKDNHGRPVAFGAGLLSKENADSFAWLFERFVKCMGSAPKLIITDQDLGMKVAVERVLVDTRHRWCMWHIMFKVVEKLPKNLLGNEDLKKELNNCVWSELTEPEEFDEEWNKVMEKYGLKDNEWFSSMFASRKFWVPAFFRDFPMSSLIKTTSISESQNIFFKRYSKSRSNLVEFLMNYNNALDGQRSNNNRLEYLDFNTIPTLKTNSALEKHASTIYSDSGFKLIQSEIEEAVDNVTMVTVSNIGENEIYVVNDKFSKNWTVSYSTSFDSYACSCKMFGRIGLVCSHIFWVLRNKKIKLIPNELHGGRWLKSKFVKAVHCGFDDDIETFIVADETKQEYRDMHGDFYDIARLIEGDSDKIRAFRQIMAEGRKEVLGEGNVLSISEKRLMIENFYGSHVPSQIDVHPPDVVKTKGCGRRLSRLEKEMREMSKPGRKCGKCGEVGRHDSRNCDKIHEENNKKKRRNQC
ncbi:protein FAR1-RELATED SEQUENCE 5-like [Salvia splendens]|uniref:protein FAR1-RELATED SEQUENCE 5-like n=1 Tax=Salvia splendens TaxID=180675 RepID=UPI001C260BE9|nr:protein FAR1-RELATED SEQUENCE 5-like [Salvia splendens]